MCGRFTLTVDTAQLQAAFPWLNVSGEITPHYNIAPSQPVAVVPNNGENRLEFFNWGLIPSWAKDPEIGNRMINARSETLADKPSFRTPLRKHRCLILANGFFEWRQNPEQKSKTPMYIRLKSGAPFAFAGLWDTWMAPEGLKVKSCTIITTSPNSLLEPIHNRMPVILKPDAYKAWLALDDQLAKDMLPLLSPYPSEEMEAYPVGRYVNSPNNDTPECILPVS